MMTPLIVLPPPDAWRIGKTAEAHTEYQRAGAELIAKGQLYETKLIALAVYAEHCGYIAAIRATGATPLDIDELVAEVLAVQRDLGLDPLTP